MTVDDKYMDGTGKFHINDTGLVMYSHGEYFGFGDKPVSYTHLDVYKRQVGTQIKDIHIRRTEGVSRNLSMKKARAMMKIPVSYTHLDVYKRQEY